MKDLEKSLKALANRRRLAILKFLKNRVEASVGEIAAEIKLSFKATSKHLGILSAVDVLDKEQRSLQIYYSIARSPKQEFQKILSLL